MKKSTIKKVGNIVEILGIKVNSTEPAEVLKKIIKRIQTGQKTFIVTPNPEFLVFASAEENRWFKSLLNNADLAIPDGVGLVWASRLLGRPLTERVSGTDLMERLCLEAAKRKWRVYLFGGLPGVAEETLVVLKKRYPGLTGWAADGPNLELGTPVCRQARWDLGLVEEWVEKINQKSPELLFVALGMGKQEKFIFDNWQKLNVKLAMGVGGAFDYLSGKIPRAPVYIRSLGFEWLYRLLRQPWRLRRQLALLKFIWLVLREGKAR